MAKPPPMPPEFDPEFNPYVAPKVELNWVELGDDAGLYREYDLLVAKKRAEFPDRCVKCNRPAEGYRLRRNLSWHNPVLYVALLSPLIYIILALCLRKTARLDIGLCRRHRQKRARTIWIAWLTSLASLGLMIVGGFLADTRPGPGVFVFLIPIGLAGMLVGMIYGVIAAPPVKATKINDRCAWLSGVGRTFLEGLGEVPEYIAMVREPIRFGK